MKKQTPEYFAQRLETCRKLFFQYEGREHARIEREMRAGGFPDFNRRCLYARGINSGWIEKFSWEQELQRGAAETADQNRKLPSCPRRGGRRPRLWEQRASSSAGEQNTSRQAAKTQSKD